MASATSSIIGTHVRDPGADVGQTAAAAAALPHPAQPQPVLDRPGLGGNVRAALADPDATDVLLDEATKTPQAIDAQVQAGQPLTAEQRRYITEFANIAGTDALTAIPRLADFGVQAGADRAEAAVAGTLSALTNPTLGGTADVAQLPAVLRTLTEDPLSAVDDPGRRGDLLQQLDALPRYEGVNQLLGATAVPLGEQFSVTAGQQALKSSSRSATANRTPMSRRWRPRRPTHSSGSPMPGPWAPTRPGRTPLTATRMPSTSG